MRISAALPHGVSAFLGVTAKRRRELEDRLVASLAAAGFEEIVLPIVDYLEPYESLLTAASRRELYQLIDRDGELLALRGDFTPMLARLIAPRLGSLALPLELFYRGDVVRFQEDRPGRLREHYQLGAELLGPGGEEAEERMLRLFLELLGAAGEQRIEVVLGFAGALDEVLAAIGDSGSRASLASALSRRDRSALRRSGAPALLEIAERGIPDSPAALGAAASRLSGLLELSERLDEEYPRAHLTVDLAEFAHLALDDRGGDDPGSGGRSYYDGLVFRAYLGATALPVGGGGRYDRLFRALGAEVPAVGFSLSLDRLIQGAEDAGDGRGDGGWGR